MSMGNLLRAEAYWQRQVRKCEDRIAELETELAALRLENDNLHYALAADLDSGDPIPFLPVDPEEQRRMNTVASDGQQAMIYRSPS